MKILPFEDLTPKIEKTVFLAQGSFVIGDVQIAAKANVWFNSVLRGDVNFIKIGESTNIQDLSMLHVTEENPLIIGKNVTVGHSVILHACTVEDGCLIGMGAKILDGSVIGKNSLVAAGSVVPPNKIFPPNSFIIGAPAKRIRELSVEEIAEYSNHYKTYVELATRY